MTTATTVDLWPDDIGQATSPSGPITLLKSQATILSDKTSGLVTVDIQRGQARETNRFVDNFYLFGPKINYRYLLFSVWHPIEFYPAEIRSYVEVIHDDRERAVSVTNDDELTQEVKRIFGAERTREVIGAIITRSKQEE